jgi:hypothetical protein
MRVIGICKRSAPATRTLSTSGSDPNAFSELREINDSIEAGFNYTTPKRHIKYSFYTRTVFDGNNSDQKFWIGGGIEMPLPDFSPAVIFRTDRKFACSRAADLFNCRA